MTATELMRADLDAVAGKSKPGPQNLRCTEETRQLTVTWDGGGVVRLEGELDLATVAEVEAGLNCHITSPGRLVFDLSELTFMGSEGIHLFNQIAKKRHRSALWY